MWVGFTLHKPGTALKNGPVLTDDEGRLGQAKS